MANHQRPHSDDKTAHAKVAGTIVPSRARRARHDMLREENPDAFFLIPCHEPSGDVPPRLLEMADFAKSAAATGLATKQGGGGKGMIRGKLGREVVVQLFKKWVQSDDRAKASKKGQEGRNRARGSFPYCRESRPVASRGSRRW